MICMMALPVGTSNLNQHFGSVEAVRAYIREHARTAGGGQSQGIS